VFVFTGCVASLSSQCSLTNIAKTPLNKHHQSITLPQSFIIND